jgi:hypothetical protein
VSIGVGVDDGVFGGNCGGEFVPVRPRVDEPRCAWASPVSVGGVVDFGRIVRLLPK